MVEKTQRSGWKNDQHRKRFDNPKATKSLLMINPQDQIPRGKIAEAAYFSFMPFFLCGLCVSAPSAFPSTTF